MANLRLVFIALSLLTLLSQFAINLIVEDSYYMERMSESEVIFETRKRIQVYIAIQNMSFFSNIV